MIEAGRDIMTLQRRKICRHGRLAIMKKLRSDLQVVHAGHKQLLDIRISLLDDAVDVFDRLTHRHRYEKLVERIGRDALTGLQDRGRFDTKGPAMLEAALRSELSVSLMIINIDNCKAINDRHGHSQGDKIIRDMADTIMRTKREADELFRYGGEEFALLCAETPPGAMTLGERIGAAVAAVSHAGLDRHVTISIGVATFPTDAKDFRELLMRTDAALYEAKALGRNRLFNAAAAG